MAPKGAPKVKGLLDSKENLYDAEYIVCQRVSLETGAIHYFVKWKEYPHNQNTWEQAANIIDSSLLGEFSLRLAQGSIVVVNSANTDKDWDSTIKALVPYPIDGIFKSCNCKDCASAGRSGSVGRPKRKVDDRKGKGEVEGPRKKAKGTEAKKNEIRQKICFFCKRHIDN